MLTRSLAVVLFLLSTPLALAAELKEFRARMVMARLDQLPTMCNVTKQVYACTNFVAPSLTCHCTKGDSGWSIDGTVRYLPYLIVSDRLYIKHELLHLNDIRESAKAYLAELSRRTYESEGECLIAAKAEEMSFQKTIDRFKIGSIAKRDSDETLAEVDSRVSN